MAGTPPKLSTYDRFFAKTIVVGIGSNVDLVGELEQC